METRRDETIGECVYVTAFVFVSLKNVMEVEMNTEWTQKPNDSLEMSGRAYQTRHVFKIIVSLFVIGCEARQDMR